MKKNDFILVAILLIVALLSFIVYNSVNKNNGPKKAVIFVNGDVYTSVDLPVEQEKTIIINKNGHENIIVIKNDSVFMQHSDCNDQLCVKQGEISNTGQTIVCLPNKVVIEIKGKEESDIDAVSN